MSSSLKSKQVTCEVLPPLIPLPPYKDILESKVPLYLLMLMTLHFLS